MKKILYLVLICSVLTLSTDVSFAKSKKEKEPEKVHIVKPEKVKVNKRLERKKSKQNAETKKQTSKEAEGMYETKFPVINSQIE